MSLADKLSTPPAPIPTTSAYDRWIASLPDADRKAVDVAIRNPEWRHTDLQKVLEAEGAPKIANATFGAWRRKRTS